MIGQSDATPPRRSFGAGAIFVGTARVLVIASVAVTTTGVARLLGPVDSGRFAVVLGLAATLVVLAPVGTELGVVWMVSRGRWSAGSALLTSSLAAFAFGIAGICAGLALYVLAAESVLSGIELRVLVPGLACLPFALAALYVSQVALARGRYDFVVLIGGSQAIGLVVTVVPLAALYGLPGATWGLLAASVVAAAASGVVGRALSKGGRRSLDLARLRASASFGWRFYAANVLGLVLLRFDLFVLNASVGGRQVGYYAAAVAIASLSTLGADAVSGVLFPRIAALSSDAGSRSDALLELETKALRHAVVALVLGAVLSALILLTLVEPILGERFGPARLPGLVILPGMAALGVAGALYASLAGRGRPGYALTSGLILAPISIGLCLVLIPRFGATGAAAVSTLTYCASAVLAGMFLRRVSGRSTPRRLIPGRSELEDYRRLLRAPSRRRLTAPRYLR